MVRRDVNAMLDGQAAGAAAPPAMLGSVSRFLSGAVLLTLAVAIGDGREMPPLVSVFGTHRAGLVEILTTAHLMDSPIRLTARASSLP